MHVPAELHHDEPVSEPKSGHDNNNILPTTGLGPGTKLHDTEVSGKNGSYPYTEEEQCPAEQEEIPKPKEDINFLI